METKSITTSDLNKKLHSDNPPLVFDVRKSAAFEQDPRLLPGASRQIHDEVERWAQDLSAHSKVVVYCVHGHEVSQNAAQKLCDLGHDARYIEGGFEDWIRAELPVGNGDK